MEKTKRDQILELAMDVASSDGLEGLTIGSLSKLAGMSKSGLFAHFGAKEELQIATVCYAQEHFKENVWDRVQDVRPGIVRLRFMLFTWIHYIENNGLRGGCFFSAAAAEFDGRPGEVRDRIAVLTQKWIKYLEQEISVAQEMGQIVADENPERLTFSLHALVQEANLYRQLFGRGDAFDLARATIEERVTLIETKKGRAQLERNSENN